MIQPTRFGGRPDTELVVVLDCADLERSAAFWCAALGYRTDPAHARPPQPGDGPYRRLLPATGAGLELLLQQTAEPKVGKNRVHLGLRVPDLDAELTRLLAAGARHTTGHPVTEDGWRWYILADPDGNEFCVLQRPT
jgi:catechol 2,3-dioxygenase-like lactoylglutathione lyase family enzyme